MIHQFDGYGSHIMILDCINKFKAINSVVEYGGGDFSTKFFKTDLGLSDVTTIETQDHDWYKHILEINSNTKWIPDHDEVMRYARANNKRVDMVFLDTHQNLRYKLVPIVSEYTDIIILHDSDTTLYNYHKIEMDWDKWAYADFVVYRPWTGVLCKRKSLLLHHLLCSIPGIVCDNMSDKMHISSI
jgi:hypothetical protein